jgi:hypothetical protein
VVQGVADGANCRRTRRFDCPRARDMIKATDIGYTMIFPGMTIVKILFGDMVPALL